MSPFPDPDRDEIYSRVDDEVRLTERRWLGGGLEVGIIFALLVTFLGGGCVAAIMYLWQEFTG